MISKFSKMILFVTVILCSTSAYALTVETHEAINKRIANGAVNSFSLNSYLSGNIGIKGGVEEYINGKMIYEWISLGGRYEDAPPELTIPYQRSVNHFHNPINNSGLTSVPSVSVVDWATLPLGSQNLGGSYSWNDVRGYYLNALTSTAKEDRDNNFAQTFRGLGQLMHLVSDMSVPEHTRNDIHLAMWYLGNTYSDYENWVSYPGNVAIDALSPIPYGGPMQSIVSLFDTGQYDRTNPGVTGSNTVGLSEFTNANFLSDDTIFTGFTYPAIQDTEMAYDPAQNRNYLKKPAQTAEGRSTGIAVDHLAAVSLLYYYRWRFYPQDHEYYPVGLDGVVYNDYANLLLPRAVGYSADLLKYFFRGQMEMIPDTKNAGKYIINNKSNEAMNGQFSLFYDATDDKRYPVQGVDFSPVNGVALSPGASSASISGFQEPADMKKKGEYMLVFQGRLGYEDGAVVGSLTKGEDIWEPWNSGAYSKTAEYHTVYDGYDYGAKNFFFATDKHIWSGGSLEWSSPSQSFIVDNGILKIDMVTGGYYNPDIPSYVSNQYGWLIANDSSKERPVAKCRLKMSIPSAAMLSKETNDKFTINVMLYDGTQYMNIGYALDDVTYKQDWDIYNIYIPVGDSDLSLAEAYNHIVSLGWFDPGDINKWKVVGVFMYYNLQARNGSEPTTRGYLPNSMSVAIDYIDFVCGK